MSQLPLLNASLNGLSAALMTLGFIFIKMGRRTAHKRLMLSALFTSACFLCSYLYYHLKVSSGNPFAGEGLIRYVYFPMLISHILLAVAVVPMVLITVRYGLKDMLKKHVPLARWTLGVWWYVSITGVLVYMFVYRWYPA